MNLSISSDNRKDIKKMQKRKMKSLNNLLKRICEQQKLNLNK